MVEKTQELVSKGRKIIRLWREIHEKKYRETEEVNIDIGALICLADLSQPATLKSCIFSC